MVVFLTGGNGGIGSIIKEHLLNNNIDVLSPNSKNLNNKEINQLNQKIPLGLTDAWSIADFLLYMIKYNKSITGQNIVIDGGYSLIGA